ncbi:dCTP deaminase [Patescibacteria group bacterium]
MAVLTKGEILKLIDQKIISISPFDKDQVGPASIDFHLGNQFRVFKDIKKPFLVTNPHKDYQKLTKVVTKQDNITILPNESIHGITKETLELPNNLCGWIQGRSSLARIGLMVHITANFIHPGQKAKQVLEMTNAGPIPLIIPVGIPICQIILEETKGEASYQGKFFQQDTP